MRALRHILTIWVFSVKSGKELRKCGRGEVKLISSSREGVVVKLISGTNTWVSACSCSLYSNQLGQGKRLVWPGVHCTISDDDTSLEELSQADLRLVWTISDDDTNLKLRSWKRGLNLLSQADRKEICFSYSFPSVDFEWQDIKHLLQCIDWKRWLEMDWIGWDIEIYWMAGHLDMLLDGTYWPMAGWAAGNQGPAVSAAKSVFLVSAPCGTVWSRWLPSLPIKRCTQVLLKPKVILKLSSQPYSAGKAILWEQFDIRLCVVWIASRIIWYMAKYCEYCLDGSNV